jgi:hypothetical protein
VVDLDRRQAVDPAQRQADLTSDPAGRPVPLLVTLAEPQRGRPISPAATGQAAPARSGMLA